MKTTETQAKERPILFSGAMVRAILREDCPKTQTRRVVKGLLWAHAEAGPNPAAPHVYGDWASPKPCPYGEPGDRLWVREAFNFAHIDYLAPGEVLGKSEEECVDDNHGFACVCGDGVMYRADGEREHPDYGRALWKPSIHMPRWASRILMEVVSVRVERLQSITTDDIIAEGVTYPVVEKEEGKVVPCFALTGKFKACDYWPKVEPPVMENLLKRPDLHDVLLRGEWAALFESINGRGSWDLNPWVWVVEFKRLDRPSGSGDPRSQGGVANIEH